LLTASETVHDENQTAYLPFLRHLNSARNQETTSKQTLETAINIINTHQLLPELSTFHLALALHTTVPRIEAAYSWYSSNVDETRLGVEDCTTWVEWNGKGYCDFDSLRQDLDPTIDKTSDS
jgi:UDP-glucose:glycoprotein glucosyltransferase